MPLNHLLKYKIFTYGGYYTNDVNILQKDVTDKIIDVINTRQFQIYLQPIVDLHTYQMIGNEVLSRFDDIDMESFFKMVSKCGITKEVDRSILNRVLPIVSQWEGQTFVNIFPSTLTNFPFSDFDLSNITFEITEQEEINDHEKLNEMIANFGMVISIDDVGVGYANLYKLITLKPNYIKLDRKIIERIDQSSDKQDLVSALYGYSKGRFHVIAEGIEREEELLALKKLGVSLSQGYLLGRPRLWNVDV